MDLCFRFKIGEEYFYKFIINNKRFNGYINLSIRSTTDKCMMAILKRLKFPILKINNSSKTFLDKCIFDYRFNVKDWLDANYIDNIEEVIINISIDKIIKYVWNNIPHKLIYSCESAFKANTIVSHYILASRIFPNKLFENRVSIHFDMQLYIEKYLSNSYKYMKFLDSLNKNKKYKLNINNYLLKKIDNKDFITRLDYLVNNIS